MKDPRWAEREAAVELLKTIEGYVAELVREAMVRVADQFTSEIRAALPIDRMEIERIAALWGVESAQILHALEAAYLSSQDLAFRTFAPGTSPQSVLAAEFTRDASSRLAQYGDDLASAASNALAEGVLQGEGYDELRGRLVDTFNEAGKPLGEARAEAIARTQVHEAFNRGTYDAALAMKNGPRYQAWLATADEHTRPAHWSADKQIVRIGHPFMVGGEMLRYPGDPHGSPDNIVNCRCVSVLTESNNPLDDTGRQYLSKSEIGRVVDFFEGKGVRRKFAASLTAAAKTGFSGAIVSLIPAPEEAARLALEGYEGPDSLHITLSWMGDTEGDPAPQLEFDDVVEKIRAAVDGWAPITAEAFAQAVFNPGDNTERDPATVLLLQSDELSFVADAVSEVAPDQSEFSIWFPHLTLGYNVNPAPDCSHLMGPVTFDRVRVSYGSEQTEDIMLIEKADVSAAVDEYLDIIESGRIRALTFVDIPAFPDARVSLVGEPDENGLQAWEGPIAFQSTPTGDRRQFNTLTWADLPLPLRWVKSDEGFHFGAVLVGRVDNISVQGNAIQGAGVIDVTTPEGTALAALMAKQMAGGVSVDLDDLQFPEIDPEDDPFLLLFDDEFASRLRGLALTLAQVQRLHPATAEAMERLKLSALTAAQMPDDMKAALCSTFDGDFDPGKCASDNPVDDPEAFCAWLQHECTGEWPASAKTVTAAVTGNTDLPIADRELEWDGPGASSRVLEWADGDADKMAQAFLYQDAEGDPATAEAYKLGFADIVDGELQIVPRGVFACTGSRGVDAADIPDEDKASIKTKVCGLYSKMATKFDDPSITCPFNEDDGGADDDLVASAYSALKTLDAFPAEWFTEPKDLPLDQGAVHVDNGRIFGWVARRGEKHEVLGVNPPLDNVDLTTFLRHKMTLADGSKVAVGAFTMNVGHHRDGAECETAVCQFDDTRTVAGVVTIGVNEGGMWFSGAAAPWLSSWDRAVFTACQPSGHWRWMPRQRQWSLRAVLSVPAPAFPTPLKASAGGEPDRLVQHIMAHTMVNRANLAIVASNVQPEPEKPETTTDLGEVTITIKPDMFDTQELVDHLAHELEARAARRAERDRLAERTRKVRAERLKERVKGARR